MTRGGGRFKLDNTPDAFGHLRLYVLRGKHWHKMSDFQMTGLECTMVREAAGGDEEPTLNCLKQDGTTVTVPLCLDKLTGRSTRVLSGLEAFGGVAAELHVHDSQAASDGPAGVPRAIPANRHKLGGPVATPHVEKGDAEDRHHLCTYEDLT